MEKAKLEKIINSSNNILEAMINNWTSFEGVMIVFTYAELLNRDYKFNESHRQKLDQFSKKFGYTNIEEGLNKTLVEYGYSSYQELIEKEIQHDEIQIQDSQFNKASSSFELNNKYKVLRAISGIYKILGWLLIVVTLLISVSLGSSNFISGIIAASIGTFSILSVFAISEFIMLIIDIEENTRRNRSK